MHVLYALQTRTCPAFDLRRLLIFIATSRRSCPPSSPTDATPASPHVGSAGSGIPPRPLIHLPGPAPPRVWGLADVSLASCRNPGSSMLPQYVHVLKYSTALIRSGTTAHHVPTHPGSGDRRRHPSLQHDPETGPQ
ncbi:hypothetical protein C8Q78DRAFT_740610 [Trametes maxima]|nr:hypothetical protein C8Q78DRAFT_740610 [Trametes maxima]